MPPTPPSRRSSGAASSRLSGTPAGCRLCPATAQTASRAAGRRWVERTSAHPGASVEGAARAVRRLAPSPSPRPPRHLPMPLRARASPTTTGRSSPSRTSVRCRRPVRAARRGALAARRRAPPGGGQPRVRERVRVRAHRAPCRGFRVRRAARRRGRGVRLAVCAAIARGGRRAGVGAGGAPDLAASLPVARAATAARPSGPAGRPAPEPVAVSRLADGGGSAPPSPSRVLGWTAASGFAATSASDETFVQGAVVVDEVSTQVDAAPAAGPAEGGVGRRRCRRRRPGLRRDGRPRLRPHSRLPLRDRAAARPRADGPPDRRVMSCPNA